MSEPQLRCLLCDLILADEHTRDQPTETCKQCGRKVLAGQTVDEAVELQPLNPPPKSKPLDLDIELLPEAAVVPPTPAVPDGPIASSPTSPSENSPETTIPTVPVLNKARRVEPDVPTVQPRGKITTDPTSVPYASRRGGDVPPARPGPASPPAPLKATPVFPTPSKGKQVPPPPPKKVAIPDPSRVADTTPRPKVLQAFAILGCMTVLAIAAIVVIISCIVIGLMKAGKIG